MDKHNKNKTKLIIDFGDWDWQISTELERNLFCKSLTNAIKMNKHLKRLTIECKLGKFNEMDWNLSCIINALQDKRSLEYLSIDLKGYTLNSLPQVYHLKELHLNVNISTDDLIELCKTNPNLRELSILKDQMPGTLAGITQDGTTLRKLEVLDFQTKSDINADDYANIGTLPKLDYLRIRGTHKIGSFMNLFNNLSIRKSERNLRFLYLDESLLNFEEIQAITRIDSLEEFKCGFSEIKCIGLLSQMKQLTELRITSKHDIPEMLVQILNILKETQLNYVSIHFHDGKIDYDKTVKELTWELFVMDVNASDYEVLAEMPNLLRLHITGINYKLKSVLNIFAAYSRNFPQILQHFKLSSHPHNNLKEESLPEIALNSRDISALSTIKSLKSLECSLADVKNIDFLGQLPQLEKLNLKIRSILTKQETDAFKNLFRVLASNSILNLLDILGASIDLSLTIELVQIKSLKNLKCGFSCDECIEYLQQLIQLEYLEIESEHNFENISQWILQILASSTTSIKIHPITYDSDNKELFIELPNDGNTDATHFGALGNIENCQRLYVIGERKLGSFYSLLETLSKRKTHSLIELDFEGIPINYKETLLISQIQTLKVLNCIFSDSKSFEIFHSQLCFKKIKLKDKIFPTQIFDFLNNSKGTIIIENNAGQIKYLKNQGKLVLKNISCKGEVIEVSNYACFGNLDNLQIVHIISQHKVNSLNGLFQKLASCSSPKELIVDGDADDATSVGIKNSDLMEIAKIKSLTNLKCGFLDAPKSGMMMELPKLQKLSITRHQDGSLCGVLHDFSSETSVALQSLSIESEGISYEELTKIAHIKTLNKLICQFVKTKKGLPRLLHLTELYIKSHQGGRLFTDPEYFDDSVLQSLKVMGAPLDVEDLSALAQHKLLKKLHIKLQNMENIDLISPLDELEEFYFELIEDFDLPEQRLQLFNFPANIKKLTINNLVIDCNDLTKILQLLHLKSLNCILDIEENTHLCGLDRLEELKITLPKEGSVKILIQALTYKTPSSLKHLVIIEELLDKEDMLLLSQIHSLNTLECGLLNDDSFMYLAKLVNLETLIVTSDYYMENVSTHLLNIFRDCTKLQFMDLSYCDEEITRQLIYKILKILKNVRNPTLRNPLRLRVADFPNYPQEQFNSMGEKYYIIEVNKF